MSAPVAGPSTPQPQPQLAEPASMAPFIDGRGSQLAVRTFRDEDTDLPGLTRLCEEELSEPYNVYTFRYFLTEWPHLTFFVYPTEGDPEPIATIICKQDMHRERTNRGYIGMLSVTESWRRRGIARRLVELAVKEMETRGAQEIVMETEFDNGPSLALYEALGFVREKRLHRFYSNGKDAFRLILPLSTHPLVETTQEAERGRFLISQGPEGREQDGLLPPPEIAYVLAGPAAMDDTVADVARMSLEDLNPRPRPDYII